MQSIALLGDSIFDNAVYTNGGPAVIDHLRRILPSEWEADLFAVDGSTIEDVRRQLFRLTPKYKQLVLSVGGNDLLLDAGVLGLKVETSGEALLHLADSIAKFEAAYGEMIAECLTFNAPLAVCTIYECNFDDARYQRIVATALRAFNDAIIRTATRNSLRVIELRLVCNTPEDYANPIEPSVQGGAKIAEAIVRAISEPPNASPGARVAA